MSDHEYEPGERLDVGDWDGQKVAPGEQATVDLAVGESYSGMTLNIPLHVKRGMAEGPTLFVTAALHGDEINGTGAIRELIQDESLRLVSGAVILVPVLNILAFDRHSRYLPDRRDLNRSFPGSRGGSLASRFARTVFEQIVGRADYGIDLHTAAVRRTNYPTVRGDLKNPGVARIARAFGVEFLVDGDGPAGSLRREAAKVGCPTIVMEGGEVWKVEPAIVEAAVRGVRNVLCELGMLAGQPEVPASQVSFEQTKWLRADHGGFLQYHVSPGEFVEKDEALATNTNLLGDELRVIRCPFDAVVIGMTTLPAVSPGEPVVHLGQLPEGTSVEELRRLRAGARDVEDLVDDLASSLLVVDSPDEGESE